MKFVTGELRRRHSMEFSEWIRHMRVVHESLLRPILGANSDQTIRIDVRTQRNGNPPELSVFVLPRSCFRVCLDVIDLDEVLG